MFEGNTDLSSVLREGDIDMDDGKLEPESYTPYYTPSAKPSDILQAEAVNPITPFNMAKGEHQGDSPAVNQMSTPTTTEPDPENIPYDDFSPKDQECYSYVHVEAYALARCAQKTLKHMNQIPKDKQKEFINKIVAKIDTAI